MKDSVRAGAFLIFYLAVYWAAGYAGIALIEWAWMKVFG
jgi:fatty acid desaturase